MVPPRGSTADMPYKVLGQVVLASHYALRMALWKTCNNPLALLLGKPSFEWHKANVNTLAVVPYSQTKIFGKRASLRIEAVVEGNITRLTVPVLHPSNTFYPLNKEAAVLNDFSWNFVLACAGMSLYNTSYFEHKSSLKQFQRNDDTKVNWGALGTDLVTFVKATRRYEVAKNDVVDLSEFPAHILAILKENKIQLTSASPGRSPSLSLAQELWRKGVASHVELDYPNLQRARGVQREGGFKELARAREAHRKGGFLSLRKGLETQRKKGFPALRRGTETQRKQGFPGVLKSVENQRKNGFGNLAKGRDTIVKNALERRAQKLEDDIANGIAPEVAVERDAMRKDRRIDVIAQQRAEAVGLGVNQLKEIERDLSDKAGMKIGKWREKHPLESLSKGQYDIYASGPAVIAKRNAQSKAEQRAHAIYQERVKAAGSGVEKLKKIERDTSQEGWAGH